MSVIVVRVESGEKSYMDIGKLRFSIKKFSNKNKAGGPPYLDFTKMKGVFLASVGIMKATSGERVQEVHFTHRGREFFA